MKNLILITLLTISAFANNQASNSVVKIFSSLSLPNYKQPWQTSNRIQVSGSGVIIKGNYIITNAHVVSDAKFVQVAKDKSSKKYTAKIKYISHQADLALLEVKDEALFKDTKPLNFTEEVSTGNSVTVLGYPLGGNSLSTTKGVISRIESHAYVWSYEKMLAIQIDASINSGNSGGAAINDKDELVGIVMQGYSKSKADNIGYIIPSIIVNTFLEDIKDKKVDGYDNSNTLTQKLENEDLKSYLNVKSNTGVIITELEKDETVLKENDLLLEVDNNEVANDGTIKTKYGTQLYKYLFHTKPVGSKISMKIKRDNKIIDVNYILKTKNEIIKNEKFKEPRYIIFGGLVFAPMTKNYLRLKNINSILFKVFLELEDEAKHVKESVIVQYEKFDHNINEGYRPVSTLIKSVNGIKVVDFAHFVKLIDESKDKYTVIDFLDANKKYVFETKKARESFEEIKNIYGLSTDRRVH